MNRRVPRLRPLLSEDDMSKIEERAIQVLAEIGLFLESEFLLGEIKDKPGITTSGKHVMIDRETCARMLEEYKAGIEYEPEDKPLEQHDITVETCAHAHHFVDLEDLQVKPFTSDALAESIRIADAFADEGMTGSNVCGTPQDVPGSLQSIRQFYLSALHARSGPRCVNTANPKAEAWLVRMQDVMGRQTSNSTGFHLLSPLRMCGNEFDAALRRIRNGTATHIGTLSMPMIGSTAPVHIMSTFVQALAEGMGSYFLLKIWRPELTGIFQARIYCFDMGSGCMVYGSPEQNLIDVVQHQLSYRYSGNHGCTRSLFTMSSTPGDPQAMAEKSCSAVSGAALGAPGFIAGGLMSLDELFSVEQLVLDLEILKYAQRWADGVEFSDDILDRDINVIKDVIAGKEEFLSHEETVLNFRKTYWMPRLFNRKMLQVRLQEEQRDLRKEARARIKEKLNETEPFELQGKQRTEIDKLYKAAEEDLSTAIS